jgi:hypothetical protein
MGAIDEAMCRAIDADSPSVVELLQRISEVCMKYSAALAQYVIRERVEPAKVKAQVIETLDFLHTILSNAQVRLQNQLRSTCISTSFCTFHPLYL